MSPVDPLRSVTSVPPGTNPELRPTAPPKKPHSPAQVAASLANAAKAREALALKVQASSSTDRHRQLAATRDARIAEIKERRRREAAGLLTDAAETVAPVVVADRSGAPQVAVVATVSQPVQLPLATPALPPAANVVITHLDPRAAEVALELSFADESMGFRVARSADGVEPAVALLFHGGRQGEPTGRIDIARARLIAGRLTAAADLAESLLRCPGHDLAGFVLRALASEKVEG